MRVARDPAYFTYLRDCPVRANVVLGDARLTLAREPSGRFALLVLDAFSSDAIPVHLLTREALALYGRLVWFGDSSGCRRWPPTTSGCRTCCCCWPPTSLP